MKKTRSNFILNKYMVPQNSENLLDCRSDEYLVSQYWWKLLHCCPKRYCFHCVLWRTIL